MKQKNNRDDQTYWAQIGLQPPYSLEAEQAVLGSVLMDGSQISRVADLLRPEHFYLPEHQSVYRVMLDKMMVSQVIDFVTVLEAVKSETFFAGEEGKKYLFKMAQMVPAIVNIEHYARIIRNKFDARDYGKRRRSGWRFQTDDGVGSAKNLRYQPRSPKRRADTAQRVLGEQL